MLILRAPTLIKLCKTENTSGACANEASVGFEGLIRGTYLSSISSEMAAKLCFNSSVGSFFICSTNGGNNRCFTTFWDGRWHWVHRFNRINWDILIFLPFFQGFICYRFAMVRIISVLDLSNFRSIWIPILSVIPGKLHILVINSSLENNTKHSVRSLWFKIRPTGLSMSAKSRVASSGWKTGI